MPFWAGAVANAQQIIAAPLMPRPFGPIRWAYECRAGGPQ